jgi:uncharacterized protein YcsI (UPF0317 family)
VTTLHTYEEEFVLLQTPAPSPTSHAALKAEPLETVRDAIRQGAYTRHTAGLGAGHLQCNLVILPLSDAADFEIYCAANAQACPLVGKSKPGDPAIPSLGATIDLRTDVPLYNVYRNGVLDASVSDLKTLWQDDWVAFAIGCSFTFERALMEAGIAMRHVEQDRTVPMFITNRQTVPSGVFRGAMVASMRPIAEPDVERAKTISARYPLAHGAPIHIGDPKGLGIADLNAPNWGDQLDVLPGEVPVVWACGVTPQVAITNAKPAICVTHAPGSMLITDLDEFHGAIDTA